MIKLIHTNEPFCICVDVHLHFIDLFMRFVYACFLHIIMFWFIDLRAALYLYSSVVHFKQLEQNVRVLGQNVRALGQKV